MIAIAISSKSAGFDAGTNAPKGESFLATVDPRLLQLFETLIASGADWLVFELIGGIEAGIVVEETADDLASARIRARQERESQRSVARIAVSPESRPLGSEDQVVWAARYVGRRLKEVLAMMDSSAERLNMLVDRSGDIDMKGRRSSVTLGLRDDDEMIPIGPERRAAAQSAVVDLFAGLETWVREVTGRQQAL